MRLSVRALGIAFAVVALATAAITGCGSTPRPTQQSTAVSIPEGWKDFSSQTVSLALPSDWTAADLTGDKAQAYYDALAKNNPELAKSLGSASALAGADFWATGPGGSSAQVRRISREGDTSDVDPLELLQPIIDQFKSNGFEVTKTEGGLTVAGLPAGEFTYQRTVKDVNGNDVVLATKLFLLLTRTDAWMIGYGSYGVGSPPIGDGTADKSVQTFRTKG